MDLNLKQWRNQQHESDQHHHQQTPAKIPKLLLESQHQQQHSHGSAAALPLFVPEPNIQLSQLSAFPDLTPTPTRFPRMASYFSMAQWHELELQALIFRYMLAGADVPAELLHPIKKSFLMNNTPYYLHHYPHYQPPLLQSGYWGRGAMDPEPGRCRRTDGKKWRCSRDVVAGHKYCERHMHRGRNRSRKPVEIPTPATARSGGNAGGGGSGRGSITTITDPHLTERSGGTHLAFSGPASSIDLLQLNHSSSEQVTENRSLFESENEKISSGDGRSDGRILRCFFDDWPRSLQDPENAMGSNARSTMTSSAGLSMSIPGNSSSDISLKLSTGTGDDSDSRERPQLNWAARWGTPPVAPMGGPLAEALRSSASNSSPTSVLHELQRGSASETSYVST